MRETEAGLRLKNERYRCPGIASFFSLSPANQWPLFHYKNLPQIYHKLTNEIMQASKKSKYRRYNPPYWMWNIHTF